MQYHKQAIKHNPPETYGDCVRVCIACLLDKNPDDVPHFFHDGCDGDTAWKRVETYLSTIGYCPVIMPLHGESVAHVRSTMAMQNPRALYMLVGTSRGGNPHVIICRGDIVVHDPSWSETGVVGPDAHGIFWIIFLVEVRFCDVR